MLQIKHLDKRFGKKLVLRDISATLNKHVYGILGPNGAGKTTLIRCLVRLYPDGADKIFYHDVPIGAARNYLEQIGYLPQQFGLFKELKVFEMLRLMANFKGLKQTEADNRIQRDLQRVNLSDKIDSKVGSLSGGMIRRLGIAQTLLSDPDILIFDEPTAGLDPEERLRFRQVILEIKKQRTVLISTHIVEDVEALCDQILIMNDGIIPAQGTGEQIRGIARNRVYELPEEEVSRLHRDYYVVKKYENDGEIYLRIISDQQQDFPNVNASIEDGYLCTIKGIS